MFSFRYVAVGGVAGQIGDVELEVVVWPWVVLIAVTVTDDAPGVNGGIDAVPLVTMKFVMLAIPLPVS